MESDEKEPQQKRRHLKNKMEANSSGVRLFRKSGCSYKAFDRRREASGMQRLCLCSAWEASVQLGSHSFTFDHVYGSSGTPSSSMYEECVAPLVDGLFQGYNGTLLAYGQTGSGKTHTMGTNVKDVSHTGIISRVMDALFTKIESLEYEIEFQINVSFNEIHKEEVRDLIDLSSANKQENANGKLNNIPGKPPIQIQE